MLGRYEEIELISLRAFPEYEPPEETGATFQENALLKALHASKLHSGLVLADDSGLVVPSLQGEPGVYSARYAGVGATEADNRKKLVERMSGLDEGLRGGHFVCALALVSPLGVIAQEEARCEGVILHKERGGQGHGYDSLFVKEGYRLTFAEISEETKNQVSHRRRALDKILPALINR